MIVFVDGESKIRAVDKTTDESLIPLYIKDETNPFIGWSKAKICCYMVTVSDGVVTMMTPYVDSRLLDQIDMMGHSIEAQAPYEAVEKASAGDTEVVFTGVPKGIITVAVNSLEATVVPAYHANVYAGSDIVRVFFDEPLTYAADVRLIVN